MPGDPLFTPVSFVRNDSEEIQYRGGSMILYGQNGVGKSVWLEEIASCLQGQELGRAQTGFGPPDQEGYLGVLARLADDVNPADVRLMHPPAGHNPYDDSVEQFRAALEASRAREEAVLEPDAMAAVNELLDEFSTLRLVFLAPLWTVSTIMGPGWRLHAAARGPGLRARGFKFPPVGGDDEVLWFYDKDDIETFTAYRYNRYKPELFAQSTGVGRTVFGRVIDEGRIDVASITRTWLGDRSASRRVDGVEVEGETLDSLQALTDEWATRANNLLRTLIVVPPELSFHFGNAWAWMIGQSPGWGDMSGLSFVQQRWSQVAIALTAQTGDTPYLIIDEPERGLHRAAEAHMADGLRALVMNHGVRLIAATHSPELIDTEFGQLLHLDAPGAAPNELTRGEAAELRSFGLQPTALLSRDRGYLVVEGEHDKQILEGYFSAELRDMRVKVLAMRGAKNVLSILESELLIHATDALLMPLLDDIEMGLLKDLWAAAIAATVDGRRSDAVGVIKRGLDRIPGKGKGAYEPFLIGTIMLGQDLERFLPLGMSKKDVLEYLPVRKIVPGADSWATLWHAFSTSPAVRANRSHNGNLGKAYKDWLRRVKHADLSPENLRHVANSTIAAPPELKAIIALVDERLDERDSRTS